MVSFNTWFVCGLAGHFSCGRACHPLHPSWFCVTVLLVVPLRLCCLSNVKCAAQSAPCMVATWRCTTCVRFLDKKGAPFTFRMLLTWPRAACDRPTVVQRWEPRAQLSPGKASEHMPSLESTLSLRPSGVLDAPAAELGEEGRLAPVLLRSRHSLVLEMASTSIGPSSVESACAAQPSRGKYSLFPPLLPCPSFPLAPRRCRWTLPCLSSSCAGSTLMERALGLSEHSKSMTRACNKRKRMCRSLSTDPFPGGLGEQLPREFVGVSNLFEGRHLASTVWRFVGQR